MPGVCAGRRKFLDDETEKLCLSRGIAFHSDADLRYTFAVMATGGQPLHDPNAKVTMRGKAFQQIGALKGSTKSINNFNSYNISDTWSL